MLSNRAWAKMPRLRLIQGCLGRKPREVRLAAPSPGRLRAKKSSRKLLGSQGGKGLRNVPGAIGRQELGFVR